MTLLSYLFKAIRKSKKILFKPFYNIYAKFIFILNGVPISNNLNVNGIIRVVVSRKGKIVIGDNC